MNNKAKINSITDTFGMKSEVAAKDMNVTLPTFWKKNSESAKAHQFTKQNHDDLVTYIKSAADKLEKLL
ncbi:hypothetical protein RQM65_11405 [Pricia sp. S334]|uniref:XRE family transcriptional regulator n=1 Tax=Pricia mediterranea TaxID=3076079 RepID=A0ABU3L6A0_9FLAO|nr:hypothetical protein [Pricia sp. S334]MDT7829274.1 hypothetical protein [Pricia sp. S334]